MIDWFFLILQEKYLSEHNYDEPIDVDSTLKLLNFGDDYSKFIDSLSDEISDLDQNTVKPQRTKRKVRRSTVNIFSSLPQPIFLRGTIWRKLRQSDFSKKKYGQKRPSFALQRFSKKNVIKWLLIKMLQSSFYSVANCSIIIAENDLTKFSLLGQIVMNSRLISRKICLTEFFLFCVLATLIYHIFHVLIQFPIFCAFLGKSRISLR